MRHLTLGIALLLAVTVSCGGDSAGSEAFCSAARDLAGTTPGDVEQTLATIERMRDEAPEEIEDALNTLADATEEAVETGDRTILERPDVVDASNDLDVYLEENCEAPE